MFKARDGEGVHRKGTDVVPTREANLPHFPRVCARFHLKNIKIWGDLQERELHGAHPRRRLVEPLQVANDGRVRMVVDRWSPEIVPVVADHRLRPARRDQADRVRPTFAFQRTSLNRGASSQCNNLRIVLAPIFYLVTFSICRHKYWTKYPFGGAIARGNVRRGSVQLKRLFLGQIASLFCDGVV